MPCTRHEDGWRARSESEHCDCDLLSLNGGRGTNPSTVIAFRPLLGPGLLSLSLSLSVWEPRVVSSMAAAAALTSASSSNSRFSNGWGSVCCRVPAPALPSPAQLHGNGQFTSACSAGRSGFLGEAVHRVVKQRSVQSCRVICSQFVGFSCKGESRRHGSCSYPKNGSLGFGSRLRRKRVAERREQVCRGVAAVAAEMVTLKPLMDRLLLLGTVVYVYIAGVAAIPWLPDIVQLKRRSAHSAPALPVARPMSVKKRKPIRQSKFRQQFSDEDAWHGLDRKLSQAISRQEFAEGTDLEEEAVSGPMLSLQAIARVPRVHLLLSTLHHLRREVESIADHEHDMSPLQWRDCALSVISRSVPLVCRDWLSQDLSLMKQLTDVSESRMVRAGFANSVAYKGGSMSSKLSSESQVDSQSEDAKNTMATQMALLETMTDFLRDSKSLLMYIKRSGKADLYADLIWFLRFGSARVGGCCDNRSFSKHAGNALEDMVVVVAEAVATLFLDGSSAVASLSPHGEVWQTFLLPSILSTRSLERFRNEVALYGWLNQNFGSVAAMFEDRFDLWTIQRQSTSGEEQKISKSLNKKVSGSVQRIQTSSIILTRIQLPARRSAELKALTGWRYCYSLFLEFSDVVGPILGVLLSRLGEAISFLLVRLIGRSLGLVYQGIRQSVRWSPNRS